MMNKVCQVVSLLGCIAGGALGSPLASPLAGQTFAAETSIPVSERSRGVNPEQSHKSRQVAIKLDMQDVSLAAILDTVAKQGNVRLLYNAADPEFQRRLTRRITTTSVETALTTILRETAMSFKPSLNGQTILIGRNAEMTQTQTTGTVVITLTERDTGRPITNATVKVDGDDKLHTVGSDGTLRLVLPRGEQTIRIRAVGFVQATRAVTVVANETMTVSVTLERTTSVLDEVIVTGTVVATERKAIATPITVITGEEIERRGITRVEQLLRGEVPGVVALDQGSGMYYNTLNARDSSAIYARGASTLSGGGTPLKTYIDGVEMFDPSFLGTLDPRNIERVEIVTGPQAATVYGAGAMGGVMQIFTKKGAATNRLDGTATLRFGLFQNSFSHDLTQSHDHQLGISGGTGPTLSYASTLTYMYTGPWLPMFYNRRYGASAGVTHTRGPVTASASFSLTTGDNGTYIQGATPKQRVRVSAGEWSATTGVGVTTLLISPYTNRSTSQLLSLNVDYRPTEYWNHSFTVGRSIMEQDGSPDAPVFRDPADSLLYLSAAIGSRISAAYNTTIRKSFREILSSTVTVGITSSSGNQRRFSGQVPNNLATSYTTAFVSRPVDDESWGGFGQVQLGVLDKLFITLGLRGERNPAYGEEHAVDWTPTQGVAYTQEIAGMTVKVLGSYGRATRSPRLRWRTENITTNANYDPSQYVSQVAAPLLRPEYSRGPQFGVELYYRNLASVTVNHYRQKITDLIQPVRVDSFKVFRIPSNDTTWLGRTQYQNISQVRQIGWETTGNLNVGPLQFKGTYSWTDSRILFVGTHSGSASYYPGMSFVGVPSHVGYLSSQYAKGNMSIMLASHVMGRMIIDGSSGSKAEILSYEPSWHRTNMYVARRRPYTGDYSGPGYTKSDLIVTHRLNRMISLSLNVTNLGNSFQSEAAHYSPAIGRTTALGLQLRH